MLRHVSYLVGVKVPENEPNIWKFVLMFRC